MGSSLGGWGHEDTHMIVDRGVVHNVRRSAVFRGGLLVGRDRTFEGIRGKP